MGLYYARDGQPMSDVIAWARSKIDQRVAETTLPDGKWISTVWLGLDHSFGLGPPLIFETMVFPKEGEWGELDSDRYSTEAEAIEGHARMVEKWSKRQPEESHELQR